MVKIGLCMSVVGAGGGNDTVLQSLYSHLAKSHDVTVFTKTKPLKDFGMKVRGFASVKLPVFGIFQQFMPINHKEMHRQDLLIFLTGKPPKTSVRTVYYHQQMPGHLTEQQVPEKYKAGRWKAYYSLFKLAQRFVHVNNSVIHYCISDYLGGELAKMGIIARTVYPSVERVPPAVKEGCIMTLCRISPEKRLEDNLAALEGFTYNIYGSTSALASDYLEDLTQSLHEGQAIHRNVPHSQILAALGRSSVYYSSSKETLGLAVLESIAAACIPIVIDNSANRETVPFRELRFVDHDHGRHLVDKALYGGFDYLKPKLAQHLEKFTEQNYDQFIE